jgi:hypothetical protein
VTGNVGTGVFRPVRLPAVDVAVVRQVLVAVEGRYATLTGGRITLSGLVLALVSAAVDDPEGWIGGARDDRRSRDLWQPRAALAVVWPQDLLGQVRVLAAAYDVPVSGVLGAALKSESAALVRGSTPPSVVSGL